MKRLFYLIPVLFFTSTLYAQLPNIIPYQGNMSDTAGNGYDGSYEFEFQILDGSNSSLWSSGSVNVSVSNGLYSVLLGNTGQPSLNASIFEENEIYLEISFNDGTNGMETLSPNVRILPVPYALRAAYADSTSKSPGFELGDSLILKDKNGKVRFVMNPNTGEFRMMANDTTWLSMRTNSNVVTHEDLPNGGYVDRRYEKGPNGERFLTTQIKMRKGGPVTFNKELTDEPTGGRAFHIVQEYSRYCTDDIFIREYYKVIRKYVRDTVERGIRKKAGIHIWEVWYDCKTGEYLKSDLETPEHSSKAWDAEQNAKLEEIKNKKYKVVITTEDQDTFQSTVDPKTGEITHSKKWVRYVVGMEGGKTVATYANDSTKKKASTTVDPSKNSATYENQDKFLWVPASQAQCFGINLTGGDSLRWYGNSNGFKFDNPVEVEELKTETFKYEYDGIDRVVLQFDSAGNSTQTNNGKSGRMRETHNPDDGTSIYDGYNTRVYDSRDLLFVVRDTNKRQENSIKDKKSGETMKFFYDPNDNRVRVESNGTARNQEHRSDSVITITYDWITDPSRYFATTYDPKNSSWYMTTPKWNYGVTVNQGIYRSFLTDSFTGGLVSQQWNFIDSSHAVLGVKSTGIEIGDIQVGYEHTDGISWFGSRDTKKNQEMAIGFSTLDSSVTCFGSRLYRVIVPSSLFQSAYTFGSTTMGHQWDFITTRSSTFGISASELFFNTKASMIMESQSWDHASLVAVDSSGAPLSLELFPSQNLMKLSSGRDPSIFSSDFLNVDQNSMVSDSSFVGKFLGVNGNVEVFGNLFVNGNISKGGGTFRIDHPQYPDTKYLYHSFIESPDMMNIYNGNVETNENGEAEVQLPDYFESLNMEFRYQLTCIGTFAQAIVYKEIEDNTFVIKTNEPNVKVSWQVTGIRKDDYANDNRVQVEVNKEAEMIGKRLYTPKTTKK